jgi:OST-HTH/LOTUS domain
MQGLKKAQMTSLESLEEVHLLQLIDLLISEKKWIQENKSNTFPFTLFIPSASTPSATNQKILLQIRTDPDQLSIKNPPSKKKVLSDCRKLVKEMLDEQPEGFEMSLFKPNFEKKFGYRLENKKIGYPRFVSLLQTIPGIRIDPISNKVSKYDRKEKKIEADNIGEFETDNNKEDSVFDELGPVSKEMDVGYQEPSLSDEEFSDQSETEVSADFDRETRKDQSSLIKILDSFVSAKEKDTMRKAPFGHYGIVDCSRRHESNKNDLSLGDNVKNTSSLRSQKGIYKFVADEVEDDKDKIVDSILGALKKNGDSGVMVEGKGI